MTWRIGVCGQQRALACEKLVKERFGFETFVPVGLVAHCPRKAKVQPPIVSEIEMLPGYVFVNVVSEKVNWDRFYALTGLVSLLKWQDRFAYVPDDEIMSWLARQHSGEFNNWLYKARSHFESLIGTHIVLKKGKLLGATAKITAIEGATGRYEVDIMGNTFSGRFDLCDYFEDYPQDQPFLAGLKLLDYARACTVAYDDGSTGLAMSLVYGGVFVDAYAG